MSEKIDFDKLVNHYKFSYPAFDSVKQCVKCGAKYEHRSPFKVYLPQSNLMLRRCLVCNAEWKELAKDGSAPFMVAPKDIYVGDLLLANSILTATVEMGIDNNKTLLQQRDALRREIEDLKKEKASLECEMDKAGALFAMMAVKLDKAIGDFRERYTFALRPFTFFNPYVDFYDVKHRLLVLSETFSDKRKGHVVDFISRQEILGKMDKVINAMRNRFNERRHLINPNELWMIMEPLNELFDELDDVK